MKTVDSPRPNPFPGLRPFRSDEHHLFFGREEQTAALLQLLRTNRFLAVVGTSGSGKSSLVRAGMIAELHGGTMTQAGSTWEVMILRPGGSPIENLARAFVDAELYDPDDSSTLPRLLATLNRSRFGLVEAMKQSELFEPGTNLLVVVDQFEELFRFRQQGVDSEEAAGAFVNLLLTASQQAECPIYVTITMRSDYLGDCSEIPGLAEAVNEGEYLIPRLLRDQKRDAIEKPIGVGGAKVSPLLVQRLLNEVGDDPDQLPVLQHALMRMWDAWSAGGDRQRPIDFADFEATGGLGAALSNHADEIYDALPDDGHRSACAKVFKALTEKGDDNRGIRRPTRRAQLQAIAASDRATVTTVLDAFRGAGVTFLMPGPEVELTDRTVLDLSHESLMRGWQRLRGWVEEEAQSARIFRRLLDTARLWSDEKAGLFRDPDLQIALSWREQEAPNAEWADQYGGHFETAISFLETSNAEAEAERLAREAARQRELEQAQELAESRKQRLMQQQRAAGRLRKLIAGLAVVALIAGVACVAALIANRRANTLAENARQNAERAKQSQQETAQALATVESQKAAVEESLSKAEAAERLARAAEEAGRKLLYTTDMRLAPFVWRDDRTTAEQLRVLLAKHLPDRKSAEDAALGAGLPTPPTAARPDLRGFEWRYYQHLLEQSAAVFSGHGAPVDDGALTTDGRLVTLDENGQVRRWELSSQHEDEANRRDLPGGFGAQTRVLSPDGRLAALVTGNKVHVFDTATGKETWSIDSADSSRFRKLTFSRGGDRLVLVDDKIRWLNAASGEVTASVAQKYDRVEALACSADGLTLAVVGHANLGNQLSIFRLDATTRKVTPRARDVGPGGTLSAGALSPDGRRVAVGGRLAGFLYVYDTATGRVLGLHPSAHASPIAALAFSGDGTKLATADAEGTIKIWADAGRLNSKSTALRILKGHQGAIHAVAFSTDGQRLVSASADRTARVWDPENAGADIRRLESASKGGSYVARFSADGHWIASADGTSVRLWDAATGRLVRELSAGDKHRVFSVAFSPTDQRLLAVGYGGSARVSHVSLWDIDTGAELARLPGATDLPDFIVDENTGPVGALAFSPDGNYLVAGFGSKFLLTPQVLPNPLKVWEVATRRLIRRLYGHTGYCVSLAFSRDGTLLVSGSRDSTAIIWSTATWRAARTLQNSDVADPQLTQFGRRMVEGVAFSPDGKTLAMASRGGTVQLWDAAGGSLLATLKGHSSAVDAVAFAPDGRTLASGGTDHTVRLWNVETRRELMQLDPGDIEPGQVNTLAFSPDGKQLLAGGDGAACWSAAPPVWNDPDRAAAQLRLLLQSNADFRSRIRMLSENLRLHEALAKLDPKDVRVQAALAATQANWHASRQAWPEAVAAFDRLAAADPTSPEGWLRTPGLLRLATALLHQDRPAVAARLLQGGAQRRAQDGVSAAVDRVGIGRLVSTEDGTVRVTRMLPGFPGSPAGLVPGDTILKINDTALTRESFPKLDDLLGGEAGTKVRLTVRHAASQKTDVVELTPEKFVQDAATGEVLHPLLAAIHSRLAREPRHPGLLELRAELAGQWSDAKAQVADYKAALEALSQQTPEAPAADLHRLYGRRGNAHLALRQWQPALDDYARVVTDATTDDALLANQALARAEVLLPSTRWAVLKPVEAKSERGAILSILPDDSVLASGANPLNDRYRVVMTVAADLDLAAVRLEALTDESLPGDGPGRHPTGNFAQTSWKVTATPPDGKESTTLRFDQAWADQEFQWPIRPDGHLNIFGGGEGRNGTAIWATSHPVSLVAGTKLTFEVQFKSADGNSENLGHFRLSASTDPEAIDRERKHVALTRLTDPWQKLAAAHRLQGDQRALDQLVERRPKSAGLIGDVFIQDQDKDWQRAVEIYNRGITAGATDVEILAKRARAHEALKNWDAAAADWSRAAAGTPDGAKLLAEFARRLAADAQVPLAIDQFGKAQALYERSLHADPENDVAATELAQLLLDREDKASWTILQPTEMKSQGGATLTELDDHSILAGGTNPRKDTYTFVARSDHPKFKAFRLEAMAHESLAQGGPGRSTWGNFALSGISVKAEPLSGAGAATTLKLINPRADFEQDKYPVAAALDGNPGTAWSIDPQRGRNHAAVFDVESTQQAGFEGGTKLTFTLDFQFNDKHALGRFRLAVTDDAAILKQQENRFAIGRVSDPWSRLAAAYALNGRNDEALAYFSRALQRADGYEARRPIVELAARFGDHLSALLQRQPDDPQLQLALAQQLAERGKLLLAEQRPAKAQADLQRARDLYTRLRAGRLWTVLRPTELKSNGGEDFTVEKDGSIFVSGPLPTRPVYELKLRTDLPTLTAILLETIPDARLPQGGAGRFGNGGFHLAEFTATLVPDDKQGKATPLHFGSALADYQNGHYGPATAFDGNPRTYWDLNPRERQPHWAVFGFKTPVRTDGGSLSITLDSGISQWDKHGLGRFRLSVTNDAEPLRAAQLHQDLKDGQVADLIAALAKAHAQQGNVNEALATFAEALVLAADRAGKARIIAEAAPLEGVLEKLAGRAAGDGPFQAELARHFAERGNAALADAARTKARALFEGKLAKEPENSAWAAELADVLLPRGDNWAVLTPVEMQAESGAKMEMQADGSVFVHQKPPVKTDTYSLVFSSPSKGVRGLRLEVLPDSRVLDGGSGWGGDGNFVLNELTVQAAPTGSPDKARSIALRNAVADFSQDGWHVRGAVDGIGNTGWGVSPETKKAHTAVFELAEAVGDGQATRLTVRLQHQHWDPSYVIGRFRLSVSADLVTLDRERKRLPLLRITEPWAKLAVAYHLLGDQPALGRLLKHHPAAVSGIGDLFAENQDWEAAVAEYSRAITPAGRDADLFVQRAEALEKLQRWEKAIADWGKADEVAADKSRRYQGRPSLVRRAQLYDRLRHYEKALADYNRALETLDVGLDPLIWRAAHWTDQGRWKMAAEDYRQLWNRREKTWYVEWHYSRERALLNLAAGNTDGYREAAAELLTRTDGKVDGDSSRWLVYVLLAAPDMITDANRDRLTAAADRVDSWWNPRLKAALLFRRGEFQQAADLFDEHRGGTAFEFLAAMAHHQLHHPDRAKQLFEQASTWMQQQRDSDPGCGSGVPRSQSWQDWCVCVQLQREAARQLAGPQLAELDARVKAEPGSAPALLERSRFLAKLGLNDEALADLSQVSPPPTNSSDYHGLRGRILAGLNRVEEALADLNRAVEAKSTDALVYAARGRILRQRGAAEAAQNDLEKSLGLEPSEQAAGLLADLLLLDTTRWAVLKPAEMSSQGGETFAVEPDGSIFVSGPSSERAVYVLKLRTDLPSLTALRLESILDARLPHGGAGRSSGNGNFHVGEITAAVDASKAGGAATPLVISRALADYPESENQSSTNFIDGNPRTLWDTYPRTQEAHWAVFGLKSPARLAGGPLSITLDSGISPWGPHGLGRFRLSASDDPRAFERQQQRAALLKVSDPWAKLAGAYHVVGDQAARDRLLERHPGATAGIGALYALQQDWERALAEYNKAITSQTRDAGTFAARAEAYEKLEKWELAAADWGNADLYASDRKLRYGSPSFPALEHRAQIHGRLQQWEKQIEDYTELLKPERVGDNPWFFHGRGEAYDRLRQWDKARAEFDRAIEVCPPTEREVFQFARARHFAAQGQWKRAADDLRLIYQKPTDANREWGRLRDAALIFAVAGDEANYRKTAAECYGRSTEGNLSADDGRWTVLAMLRFPDMITNENRPRLLEMAGKLDEYWKPRLTAAIHFRSGEYKQAAELFDANGPGEHFFFLAALTCQRLGKHDRARQLLEEGNAWIREQLAKDPGAGVPKPYGWQDWVLDVSLQPEALEEVLGQAVGLPRKLAIQGQMAQAVEAYAKALAEAPDQAVRARVLDELAQFDGFLTAVQVFQNDWKSAAASYAKQVEINAKADSVAWMVAPALWAYAGEAGRHREACQRMYERYQNSAVPNDTERVLKSMLLVEQGPELPPDAVQRFCESIDGTTGDDRAWFLATRALLECRKGNYAEAHKRVGEALALEKESSPKEIKLLALAVRALVYARQKDVARARRSLDHVRQVMAEDLKMNWKADGLLDGSTILQGVTVEHDKLIPEILRREAEKLVQAGAGSPAPKAPTEAGNEDQE